MSKFLMLDVILVVKQFLIAIFDDAECWMYLVFILEQLFLSYMVCRGKVSNLEYASNMECFTGVKCYITVMKCQVDAWMKWP